MTLTRCAKDKKKWCCHRACQYDLEHDNCGLCKGYATCLQLELAIADRTNWKDT